MKRSQLKNSFLLLLTAAIWGSAFVAQSVGMDYVKPFTFNGIRSAIINFPGAGTGPKVAAKDMVIGASMFVGTNSLKDAINKAIDKWNNS